jgi:FMN-dependent NADH-azoreductase
MTTLLQINASLNNGGGQSSQLANQFVAAFRARHPDAELIVRDVAAADPVPHLDAERFGAFTVKPEERSARQRAVVAYSDALIDELRQAEVIVLGLPMYNFGVPSQLKAYFDHIARAGVTFSYTENGPVGQLTGKKVVVFATRGGLYAGTPMDTQTRYVRDFLAFIGLADVEFVYAEGLAVSPQSREAGLAKAAAEIARLAA